MKPDPVTLMKIGISTVMTGYKVALDSMVQEFTELGGILNALEAGDTTALNGFMSGTVRRGRPPKALIEAAALSIEEFDQEVAALRAEKAKNGKAPKKALGKKAKRLKTVVPVPVADDLISKADAIRKHGMSEQQFERTKLRLGIKQRAIRGHEHRYAPRDVERIAKEFRKKNRTSAIAGYWAKLTPAERKAEMERRREKGLGARRAAA